MEIVRNHRSKWKKNLDKLLLNNAKMFVPATKIAAFSSNNKLA